MLQAWRNSLPFEGGRGWVPVETKEFRCLEKKYLYPFGKAPILTFPQGKECYTLGAAPSLLREGWGG